MSKLNSIFVMWLLWLWGCSGLCSTATAQATDPVASVGRTLNKDETVLLFRHRGDAVELTVIEADRNVVVTLPTAAGAIRLPLAKLYQNFADASERGAAIAFDVEAAKTIGSHLLKEATRSARGKRALIVVPEVDAFRDIPFHILVVDKDPIIRTHDVAVVPSLQLLLAGLQRRTVPLASGATKPTYSDKLGAAIARNKHLNIGYMTVFSEEATESYVKAQLPKASLVLFAPHGRFDHADASKSFLQFRPSGADDGNLYASELKDLILNPGLIFLNSCDLGRELMFPTAFLNAGASTVIASYWQPTLQGPSSWIVARVMHYVSKGDTAAFAVSQAQRDLLDRTKAPSHPTIWAPFVAMGNWR